MKKALSDFFTNSKIKEKINSEQFDLSRTLIRKRLKLDLNLDEIAQIAGFDKNYYLKMEYGDLDVSLSDFDIAIKNIEEYEEELNKTYYEVKQTFYTVDLECFKFVSKSSITEKFNPKPSNIEVEAA